MEKVNDSTIKLIEVLNLKQGLESVSTLKGVKFAYAVSKNFKKITPEIEAFDDARKADKDFEAYEKERMALCVKHSEKDKEGNPVMIKLPNGQQYDIKDMVAFEKESKNLKDKHNKAVDQREKQMADVEKLLQSEVSIDFHKVKFEDIPNDITAVQLQSIDQMID